MLRLDDTSATAVLTQFGGKYVALTALHVVVADDEIDFERLPDALPSPAAGLTLFGAELGRARALAYPEANLAAFLLSDEQASVLSAEQRAAAFHVPGSVDGLKRVRVGQAIAALGCTPHADTGAYTVATGAVTRMPTAEDVFARGSFQGAL